jgi:catechol 2,3-dioxygenase-like lactoylglutathione lyase family enzyme
MHRFFVLALSVSALWGQLAPPNQNGVSMGHVHILVPDPAAQKKIWVEAFGAEATRVGTLEILRLPGIFVVVGKTRAATTEGTDGSTVHHVGFAIKDLTAMKAKLDTLHIDTAPVNGNPKQLMAKFPDQVIVELTEDTGLSTPVAMHHIHLATPDPEKLRAWYIKNFGARPGTRATFLAAFLPGGEVDTRKTQGPQAPTKGRSLDHIGFEVHNLEAFCKQLTADGVQLEAPMVDMPQMGLKWAFVVDPEGTRIELTEGFAGK